MLDINPQTAADKKTELEIAKRQAHRQANRQTNEQSNRHTNKQADRSGQVRPGQIRFRSGMRSDGDSSRDINCDNEDVTVSADD